MSRSRAYFLSSHSIARAITAWFILTCTSLYATALESNPTKTAANHGESARPNIVLVLFDDVGYSDMSAFGGEIQTPHIEKIASEGVIVDRFYTTARCSPTRAGILSGRYPHDVGMADLANSPLRVDLSAYQGRLPLTVPLVSELLSDAGYTTYLQGKWHLGDIPDEHPQSGQLAPPNLRGFDHFIGFHKGQATPYPRPTGHPYRHNQDVIPIEKGWYSVKGLNDLTIELLDAQFTESPNTPFFLLLSSQTVHMPVRAPQDLVEKYQPVYDQPLNKLWNDRVNKMREKGLFPTKAPTGEVVFSAKTADYIDRVSALRAGMIESTDTELGRLVQFLSENGKLDNTLFIITSDNGASPRTARLANAPFRGAKADLFEGGVRSPLLARWPAGGVVADQVANQMVSYLDLTPTFLDAAGVDYPQSWLDNKDLPVPEGRSILPVLRGENVPPPEFLFWNLRGQIGVLHNGRWKLLANSPYDEKIERRHATPSIKLFDLLNDPAETMNIAHGQERLSSQLMTEYKSWARQHQAVPYYQVLDERKKHQKKKTPRPKLPQAN